MLNFFKKCLLTPLLIILLFLSGSVFAQENNSAAVQLAKSLQKFSTYTADFRQVTYGSNGHVLQTSRGRVMIKRPGGFRWESDSPTKQIILTDGKALWVYNIDLAQATRQTVNQKANINPASLLSGSIKDLTQQFDVKILPNQHLQLFQLKPKGTGVSFKWVLLEFRNGELVGMKLLNNLDETSVFSFSKIRLNQTLPTSLFQFKPPKGVDVVNQ